MQPLPNPYQPSITHAIYKQSPNDFIVQEIMYIDFSNDGEHLWLKIQKTNLNTHFVAKLLANWANIPVKDVGFSGLKDRHAITEQWFSLRLPTKQSPTQPLDVFINEQMLNSDEKITILEQHWHNKKLNRGTHQANHFIITLHQVYGKKDEIKQQLEKISTQGIPNYFGEQRFGKNADNIEKAIDFFQTGKINGKKPHPKFDREKISLYLSSARSELFNAILAQRIIDNSWQKPQLGDVMNLAGSQSIFVPDVIDSLILERLQQGDIHITGAMWGDGELKSFANIAKLENQVIEQSQNYQILAKGLIQHGLKQQRRALRLLPQSLTWQWQTDDVLTLDFYLPSGCFATSLLACLCEHLENMAKID